jgi:ferredoxin-type protein NapH
MTKRTFRRHWGLRVAFFFLGIALFYAPYALLVRLALSLTESHLVPDAHRVCLRMPFEWLLQPWMYPKMLGEPLYLVPLILLPLVAFLAGPLFCGWLCPAGSLTELVGHAVPERFKLNLGGRINPAPIRYGVLLGMMVSPFLGSYICCTFCNFAMMQNLVSAAHGDTIGLNSWASFTIVTFILWFFVLGVFIKGGRGWCNLICPAGALQGLLHALGSRFRFTRAIRIDKERCIGCGTCAKECPAWAISINGEVNLHTCNVCQNCQHVCQADAIKYKSRRGA